MNALLSLTYIVTDAKMDEYETNEKSVMEILVEVATAKREAEIVSQLNLSYSQNYVD